MNGFETARLENLRREDGWAPIRLALDIGSFGINSWAGREAGDSVIPEHDEAPTGHEELYLVTAGHATFTVGGEEIDGPEGTIVLVRDPSLSRGAVARAEGTTILTVGAKPGEAYSAQAWETNRDVFALLDEGRPAEAKQLLIEALDRYQERTTLYYNLACAEALLGETEEALGHLRMTIERRPEYAGWAREDKDLISLRGDPRFAELVG
ncbi:MAG TPA: AraC family ligand binding domain-containing protein [Gaiellaceae bacterium]